MLTRDFVTEWKRRAALKSTPKKAPPRRTRAQLREDEERENRDAKRARHAAGGAIYLRASA